AQKNLGEAVACYRQTVELDPKYPRAHYNLGVALQALGLQEEAVAAFRQALQIDPPDAQAHNNLGRALYALNKPEEAVAAFRQAIALNPRYASAHYNLGAALLRLGRFSEAKDSTGNCLKFLPEGHPGRRGAAQQLQRCDDLLTLEAKLPAVLDGREKAGGFKEYLDLAEVCRCQERFVASARFHADAFAAEPKRAEDPRTALRANAASAACPAASGRGRDAPAEPAARAQLRRQALD